MLYCFANKATHARSMIADTRGLLSSFLIPVAWGGVYRLGTSNCYYYACFKLPSSICLLIKPIDKCVLAVGHY